MQASKIECPICYDQLKQDVCVINCAAAHALHYQCMANAIQQGIKVCPLDRQNVAKCIHEGEVKILPNCPQKQPQTVALVMYQETPCYICHCNTREDLQFDEVVVCSGCENIYCHAQCEQRVTSRRFDYNYMWFCPPCRAARLRNRNRRPMTRSRTINI